MMYWQQKVESSMLVRSFEPADNPSQILLALEIAQMKWLADEIRSVIRSGKKEDAVEQIDRLGRKQVVRSSRVIPFDPNEQMQLIVETIRMYTQELHRMWEWSINELSDALQIRPSEIFLLTDTDDVV